MTYRVVFTETAESLIWQQARYIARESGSPDVATNWLQQIYESVERLESWPLSGPIASQESEALGFAVRQVVVGNYLLFYRVDGTNQRVYIEAFRHGAQSPPSKDTAGDP